jgi:hypothetical protein
VGVAGEYYVAAELSSRGFIAAITLRNSRGIDIIASRPEGGRALSIQVKTSSGSKPNWILAKKSEEVRGRTHFYVFVLLSQVGKRPDFYVVPSKVVADFISKSHRQWLMGTRRDGAPRRDTAMRQFSDSSMRYREKWELLKA